MTVFELIEWAARTECSDVHLSEGLPATVRRHGKLAAADAFADVADTRGAILSLLTDGQKSALEAGHDLDFACSILDGVRCRVNVYRHRLGLAAAIRVLRDRVPSLAELRLPPVLTELAEKPNGLVLVTGPTGSGKSTTLAAMVEHIAGTRSAHIVTVEDPVEYVFEQRGSLIHQREVGATVGSFAAALRSALREDPDVLLVGEMRDGETISTAVTAAETGHLVLSTLHTTGAAQSIDRIVDTCPPESQRQMRTQLSMVLRGVVTQQLLPLFAGNGRVAATEVLVVTDAAANLIRENKCHQLSTVMQSGQSFGMHTMHADLARLVASGSITRETALVAAADRRDFLQYIGE